MPTRSVNLTEEDDRFIGEAIQAGLYSNASEAISAALQRMEQQDPDAPRKIEWLRGTAQDAFAALDKGEGVSLASAEDIDTLVEGILAEHRNGGVSPHA